MAIPIQKTSETLHCLFEEQQQYIRYFFTHLDLSQMQKCIEMCLNCQGLLILTGIGKSGIIAEKIAMTLISTGTRALYLPAMNFLHGDIGIVSPNDLVLMLSKSGESEELLRLLSHIRYRRAKVIAFVSDANSRLAQKADLALWLPVEKELCPFDLVPTTSTEVQLLLGDLLSVALMRSKGFPLDEYANNHPSGAIGRKMSVVKDLMRTGEELPLCRAEDRLVEVIVDLSDKRCGCLLITSPDRTLLGIFTDGDLRRALQVEGASLLEKKMTELMNKSPITIEEDRLALEAIQMMQTQKLITVLPVLQEGKVVGLLRMHDIIQAESSNG